MMTDVISKQGRRKLFYGGVGVRGWGLSNNVGRHAWPMLKKLKLKTLIKTPQSSPPKKEIWTKI